MNGKVEDDIKWIHPLFQYSIITCLFRGTLTRRDGGIHADQTV